MSVDGISHPGGVGDTPPDLLRIVKPQARLSATRIARFGSFVGTTCPFEFGVPFIFLFVARTTFLAAPALSQIDWENERVDE